MLKYKAKNAKNQRTLLITIGIHVPVLSFQMELPNDIFSLCDSVLLRVYNSSRYFNPLFTKK